MKNKKQLYTGLVVLIITSFLFLYQNCGQPFTINESLGTDPSKDSSVKNNEDTAESTSLPQSFFAIHFEPRSGKSENFEYLKNLINDANKYKIKLTLQFTPTWAKMITEDSSKLDLIKKWQKNGHEVAAHHHGANNGLDADGYTNLTESEFKTKRESTATDSNKSVRTQAEEAGAETYLGSMEDFVTLLEKLLADDKSLNLITIPSHTDRESDWKDKFIYSIDNIQYNFNSDESWDGTFAILDGAKATPEYVEYGGNEVIEMEMQYLEDNDDVETAKTDHGSSGSSEIIGVITHIEDYMKDKTQTLNWMKYLQSKDANGSKNKTVSEILDNWEEEDDDESEE